MVVAAAISFKNVTYTGVRHCEIIKDITRLQPDEPWPIKGVQGFVTDENIFLTRDRALDHCYECGQIKVDENGNFDIIGGVLTSEDLW